ncbi:phosphotriesterase [Pueribacillus theae]|uniref:Phosphotriesterase n=1 Tax=Pueribacillus theae TaxID=2171751 RepID=A0A2U1JU94_9BACI|nr:phosphotriesterase-related protein [Pueribacillus theae]PWA08767.1 phosphotriesterase [Pueribacillus theae]
MVSVNSITGKIESSDLGRTLIHEHLRTSSEGPRFQFPHLYDEEHEFQMAVEQVKNVKERGIKTICDPTVMGLARDIRFMERVAIETGVQIIAATGIFTFHYLPTRFINEDENFMAEVFIRDIEVGIQNTSIKAGFLKCATDYQGITPDVEKVIRAVAKAHHRTGVPIMTHSHPASGTGLMQLDILEDEGVNPKNVLIGHCGDTDDIDYISKILDRGAYVGLDRYGITTMITTEQRNDTVISLIEKGYVDRLFLSQDYCCTTDRLKPESKKKRLLPKWSMTFLLDEVIPELLSRGVKEEHIHVMMVQNPKRWFEG